METYFFLSYLIRFGDNGLLKIAMQEVAIIFQALLAKKPMYDREILS